MTRTIEVVLLAALVTLASGCKSSTKDVGCKQDGDCPEGLVCQQGNCRCFTDDACGDPAKFYCNSFGTCQERPACLGNKDCKTGEICNAADPTGAKCIPATECGSSVHCPFNQYCSPSTSRCEPGCRSTGDCQLGWVCAAGQCTSDGTATDCTICPVSPARDPAYCDYGEVCTEEGKCQAHASQSGLCSQCNSGAGQECPSGLTCLIDDLGGEYCAASCATDLDCPNGYLGCGALSIVSGLCEQSGSGPCECTNTGTCPNGGRCLTGQEENRAYCECVTQADCDFIPAGVCMFGMCLIGGGGNCSTDADCGCQSGRCLVGGFPCTTGADCTVECVQTPTGDGNSFGMCQTTQKACGKGTGYSCNELRTGQSECRER
jgi:hypothetical protein